MRTLMFGVAAIFLLLQACTSPEGTYRPYREVFAPQEDSAIFRMIALRDALNRPRPEASFALDQGWLFTAGDSTEGLNTDQIVRGSEVIGLPHRILRPNSPLWYHHDHDFSTPGALRIVADDGAQLYLNGRRIERLHDEYFPVSGTGPTHITIRVLNNAMSGGLRTVQFIAPAAFAQYKIELTRYHHMRHLVEQAILIRERPDELVHHVTTLLEAPSQEGIADARRLLADYPFLVGPWIVANGDSTFTIKTMTDDVQTVTFRYGSSASALTQLQSQTGTNFSFTIDELTRGTVYYQLSCRKTATPVYHFTNEEAPVFSFNAWADSQSGWEIFQSNLDQLRGHPDAFGVGAGDLVGDGADLEEWRMLYNVLSTHSPYMPFHLIAGNHDYDGYYDELDPAYYRMFNRFEGHSYYSWRYSNCAFIMLDPNGTFPININPGSAQYEWLQERVRSPEWMTATWRFIVVHQPPYSQGWEGYSGDHFLRRLIDPLVDAAAVDFVVAGHTHDYEHLVRGPAHFVVLGGGGGTIEPPGSSATPVMDTVVKKHHIGRFFVNGSRLRFEAIGADGVMIDSFSVTKAGGRE